MRVGCDSNAVRTSVIDNDDGTYMIHWHAEVSGKYSLHVSIDHVQVVGSPMPLVMLPANPSVNKFDVSGTGLSEDAVALLAMDVKETLLVAQASPTHSWNVAWSRQSHTSFEAHELKWGWRRKAYRALIIVRMDTEAWNPKTAKPLACVK